MSATIKSPEDIARECPPSAHASVIVALRKDRRQILAFLRASEKADRKLAADSDAVSRTQTWHLARAGFATSLRLLLDTKGSA